MYYSNLPTDFSTALSQNEKARAKFSSMSEAEKDFIINRAHSITTSHEMKSFVRSLVDSTGF